MALWAPVRVTARSRGAALVRRHLSSFPAANATPPPAFSARHAARHDTGRWASRARSSSARASADERPPEEWDIAGLKSEARRAADRATKKVAKATTKLRQARDAAAALESKEDATLEELEKCPDVGTIEMELARMRARYRDVADLNDALAGIKSGGDAGAAAAVASAKALEIGDAPPPRPPRGPKKPKGKPPSGPRMPYFTYISKDDVEIRVGRKSTDNDELSCDPAHRDDADWWMHASGCPGSHVVIRFTGDAPPADTVLDAAALAFENSKASKSARGKVSLVRCRQVSKPRGAKAGLVHLSGDVRGVAVTAKDAERRLERLLETKR